MKTLQSKLVVAGAVVLGILLLRALVRQMRRGAQCKEGLGGCNRKACTKCMNRKPPSKCKGKCNGCGDKKKDKKGKKEKSKEGGGSGGGGGMCTVSHYTADPGENDGWTVAHDGSELDYRKNTVAVPGNKYSQHTGRKVTIEGKTYTVRDSCTSCNSNGVDFDILVKNSSTANRLGVRKVPCSWKP
jgi:hypothetical protein